MEEKNLVPDSYYEERRITPKRRQGELPRAGIWMAGGGYHVAACGSEAEARLQERGALRVASLVFDGSHADRPVRGDVTVDVYPAEELPALGKERAIQMLGWAPASN
jgi:sorbitol-specific phosphotransferase system component IIA